LQVRAKNINAGLLDNLVSHLANTPCPEQGNELLGLLLAGSTGQHRGIDIGMASASLANAFCG
jgi:hypothetical protein